MGQAVFKRTQFPYNYLGCKASRVVGRVLLFLLHGSLCLLHQLLNVGSKMIFKIDISLATDTDCSNTHSTIAQGLHWGHHCGSGNFP